MSIYHGYAVPITTYNRVMNKRIDGKNLHNEIAKINSGFKEYMNNLLLNIQGINKTQGRMGQRDNSPPPPGACACGAEPQPEGASDSDGFARVSS